MLQMVLGQGNIVKSTNSLFYELCKTFVSANIPFHKLNINVGYSGVSCGNIRNNQSQISRHLQIIILNVVKNKTIDAIWRKLDKKNICISIHETSDSMVHHVVKVTVGENN